MAAYRARGGKMGLFVILLKEAGAVAYPHWTFTPVNELVNFDLEVCREVITSI
jgi:hypothetical protein